MGSSLRSIMWEENKGWPVALWNTSPPIEEAVNPRKELAGTVVRVEHHRHAVGRGQFVYVVGGGHTAEHLGLLAVQLQGFAGIKGGTSVGQLYDDGRPHGKPSPAWR